MSEASGGLSGQEVDTPTGRSNIAIRIPNGTPERTFNGFSLNRMVRILRSGGTHGKVGPGASQNNHSVEQNTQPPAPTTVHSEQTQAETVTGSTKFASMVRQYITKRRVSEQSIQVRSTTQETHHRPNTDKSNQKSQT